ncbi:uncharacterized protein DS421_7g209300 [Arachis hypogaea]|nr:uncharacterized protein DS421_7g209300 [Arachis hypogaea]
MDIRPTAVTWKRPSTADMYLSIATRRVRADRPRADSIAKGTSSLPSLLAFPSSLVCFFGYRVKATCNCNSSFALPPASTEDRLVGTKDDRFFIPPRELPS